MFTRILVPVLWSVLGGIVALTFSLTLRKHNMGASGFNSYRSTQFGNVEIQVGSRADTGSAGIAEELLMSRDGVPFLYLGKDAKGKVADLALTRGPEKLILTLKAASQPGQWEEATYSYGRQRPSEQYVDLDFDGRFDIMTFSDPNGRPEAGYLYYDKAWQRIDQSREGRFLVGPRVFTFEPNVGWRP
jgi:hypothetical protein